MPYHNPEADDPLVLNGLAFNATRASAVEAASTFAEELARLGHPEQAILNLFQSPAYQGPHSAWRMLGAEAIAEIVRDTCAVMAACRTAIREHRATAPAASNCRGDEHGACI